MIFDEVTRRIAATPIETEPFHHFVIDNVFPADVYRQICESWPGDSYLTPINETGRVGGKGYTARSVLMLSSPADVAALPRKQRKFWYKAVSWLNSDTFIRTVLDKIAPILEELHGDDLARLSFGARPQLVVDDGYYKLGPHTDAPDRVIGLLFYCPADDSIAEQGTSIYEPLDPNLEIPATAHGRFDQFRRVRTVEFLPNRLFAFVRSPKSFHGVEEMTCDGRRRTLSWKILCRKEAG